LSNTVIDSITSDDFKNYFFRDFSNEEIFDQDITRAFSEANTLINLALFPDDNSLKIGFLYLVAHCMVLNLRAANAGIQSIGQQIITSSSVSGISESYGIPEDYLRNPILNAYAKTDYGLKYLSMIAPFMVGNISCIEGTTMP
jgi:hypothetical protein